MQTAKPIDVAAAAAHQRPQILLVGGVIKLRMELVVGGHEFLEIAGFGKLLLARDHGVELGDQRSVVLDGEATHDFQFQRLPQEMRLLGAADVDPAHDRGVLREHLDQTFFVEPHQRVTDRRRTDPELPGKCRARQRRSRRQRQRNDHAAQPVEHLRRGLAVAIEPFGGTRGRARDDFR